jgi:4-amino-4-deoxy-L-arabinose transferase-like glycosyltransferase
MKNTSTTPIAQKRSFRLELSEAQSQLWRALLVFAGLFAVLLFWGLGELPFYTRGEPREGLVVQAMQWSGNWILPVVNGTYIPFKPPLFHWLALLAGFLFGTIDEFTLRSPSALFAAADVLVTYRVGARLWGERAGLISGIVLALCAEWWQAGTAAQVDMTLAFFISAACWYFYFLYERREFGLLKALGLPLLLGFAILAKGPVGLAVPALVILVFLGLRRDFAFLRKLHPLTSAAVLLLVAGSWYGAALWQGGAAFFFRQIVDENFRTAAGTYGHFQPVYYYLPIFLQNMLPWSCFLPPLALFLYRQRKKLAEEHLLFPLTWIGVGLAFFSASLGKRGVYVLSLYPAAAALFGAWWQKLENNTADHDTFTRAIAFSIAAFYLCTLTAFGIYLAGEYKLISWPLLSESEKFKNLTDALRAFIPLPPLLAVGIIAYIGTTAYLFWGLRHRHWRMVFAALATSTLVFNTVIKTVIFPPIVYARTMKPFISRVTEEIDPRLPLLFYRGFDFGAVFYAGRHVPQFVTRKHDLQSPFYLLIWEEDWQPLRGRRDLKMLDISEGLGAAGRHRLVLAEYETETAGASLLPTQARSDSKDYDGE